MTTVSRLDFYLINFPDEIVFTADVSNTPADPYNTISYSSGVTGSFGAPLPGMTVLFGTAADPRAIGDCRLRTWSGGAAGTIKVNENDDVTPFVSASNKIKIITQFRLWPKFPRFLQQGQQVTIFEDYDEAYTNQTNQWRPKAVAGPPGFADLEGGSAQVRFVGDRSRAMAPGATLTNYLWTARGSTEGTSTGQGTEASPVVFTWTAPGRYLVTLLVTDSNGQTDTQHTWAIIENPDNRSVSFIDFDTTSDNYDFTQGGGECSFTVRGDTSTDEFPEESMVMLVVRGDITTPTGSWPFRTNVLFNGWILTNSVRQDPDTGEVSFRAATIDTIMKNLTMFPVSLTFKNSPVDWTQAKQLTVDRAAHFLYLYRSTLGLMTPIVYSGYDELIQRQDFGPGDLYNQVQNELMRSVYGAGKVISTHQGVLYHVIDYNVQLTAERATATTRKMLHKGIWVDDVYIEERQDYSIPVNAVKMSGVHYPGGDVTDVCPLFSEAPGDAPKVYGKEQSFDRLIVESQAILNVRCGLMLGKLIERHPVYRSQFINDGSFATAPQDLFPANIEAADNDRGLAYSGNLIARRMSRSYDHRGGFFTVSVDFEPVTTGPAGATVDMPCGPPEQELSPVLLPPSPSSSLVPGQAALIAGTTGTSFYYAPGLLTPWQRRVSGLVDPDQLAFLDLLPDPWSVFKQGYNPDRYIVWGAGRGFLVRSEDSGQNWKDRSDYLETAPAWPGESANTLDNVDVMRLQGSIFAEDRLFALGAWQYTGAYHGAVAKSDDGFEFTWYNVTGSSQVRPLGMSLDRGNGQSLYVTTWESQATGLYLRRYNAGTMAQEGAFFLGNAALSDVDAGLYYVSPFTRNGQINEVFLYGRMAEPQGFTGSVHAMRNISRGATGSYSVIENTWATNLAGAFGADVDNYLYAVRNGEGDNSGGESEAGLVEGTPVEVTANGTGEVTAIQLEDNFGIVVYDDVDDALLHGRIIDISSGAVVLGAEADLNGVQRGSPDLAKVQDGRAVMAYQDNDTDSGFLKVLTRSGSLISQGSAAEFESDPILVNGIRTETISANTGLVAYRLADIGETHRLCRYTMLGTTILPGTAQDHSDTAGVSIAMVKATSTGVLYCYSRLGTYRFQIINLSTGISEGSVGTLPAIGSSNTLNDSHRPIAQLAENKFIAVLVNNQATDTLVAVIVNGHGTVAAPTFGTPLTLHTGNGVQNGAVWAISPSKAIVAYQDSTGDTVVETLEISGDIITRADDEIDLVNAGFGNGSIPILVDGKAVAVYAATAGGVYTTIITGVPSGTTFARFYHGLGLTVGTLQEKFTLPFTGVQPAAFTLDKSLGAVVMGANAASVTPVVYSRHPYTTGTSTSQGMPTGAAVMALKWI